MPDFVDYLLDFDNSPKEGMISFDSSDHVRFENGMDVTGHNVGCHRRITIQKNIQGQEGYTVTIYNLDGIHPLWGDNVQMAPKRMFIEKVSDGIVEMRGRGEDKLGASFEDYGMVLMIRDGIIQRAQLNIYDRNISIVYLP